MNNPKLAFLYSPRFWQLGLAGLLAGLTFVYPDSVWVQGAAITIGVWFGGSVTVRTIDRNAEKKLEAAQITAMTAAALPSGKG